MQILAIELVIVSALLIAIGQVFFKAAASKAAGLTGWLTNWNIWAGALISLAGAVLFIISLKFGDLSVLCPISVTSYIWVTIFAFYLFKEQLIFPNWVGLLVIILGVALTVIR